MISRFHLTYFIAYLDLTVIPIKYNKHPDKVLLNYEENKELEAIKFDKNCTCKDFNNCGELDIDRKTLSTLFFSKDLGNGL